MNDLFLDDYCINLQQLDDIVPNSVGLVKKIDNDVVTVFFLGKNKEITTNITKLQYLDITKTGKGYKMKICNRCYILKDYYKDFEKNQVDTNGVKVTRPSCIDCRKIIDGVKLKTSEKRRMETIKPAKYYVCPICKKASIPFITAKYVIDHNHQTGQAREWICDSCNTGLGRFKDDIETMQNAIEYLKKHEGLE